MIMQYLRSGEIKYISIIKVFSCFGFSLMKIKTRYDSQAKWQTSYNLKRSKK